MCFHDLQKQLEDQYTVYKCKIQTKGIIIDYKVELPRCCFKKIKISQDLFKALDRLFFTPLVAFCHRVVPNQCLSISFLF